jgi:hypothetical protein
MEHVAETWMVKSFELWMIWLDKLSCIERILRYFESPSAVAFTAVLRQIEQNGGLYDIPRPVYVKVLLLVGEDYNVSL